MADPVFFSTPRAIGLDEIIALTGAQLREGDDAKIVVSSIAPLSEGGSTALVYMDGKKNLPFLGTLEAAAIFVTREFSAHVPERVAALIVANPADAFAQAAAFMYPLAGRPGALSNESGVSPQANIASDVFLENDVIVEAGAVIGPGAAVGSGTVVGPNAVVGASCQIGRNCYIGCNTSIRCALIGDNVIIHDGARIGQDGFGYVPGRAGLRKIPQIGRVIIQNDVEIGANTTIDRGTMHDTIIGEGAKIDNLVQIAHNVRIGRQCVIAGNCGVSGSVVLGDGVMLGGGVGIADHVKIGAGAQIAASSGVMHDVPAGEKWAGSPAQLAKNAFRELIAVREFVKLRSKSRNSE